MADRFVFLLLTLLVSGFADAQTPNSSFGDDGWVRQSAYEGPVPADGRSVATQADGKIVVAGYRGEILDELVVLRYNIDGSLDTTFDGDGTAIVELPGSGRATAVAIQADQKIVVAGSSRSADGNIAVARLNANGSPDNTFGTEGTVVEDLGGQENIEDMLVQPDGKILLAGRSSNSGSFESDALLVRYDSDGSRDAGFGTNGIVQTPGEAQGVALQADNKIVVGGSSFGEGVLLIMRHNSDGSLDTTFDADGDNDGIVELDLGFEAFAYLQDIAVQPDQKIVALGSTEGDNGTVINLFRFNTNGSVDAAFDEGTDVNERVDFTIANSNAYGTSLTIRGNGKSVIVGVSESQGFPTVEGVFAAQFNTNGTLDTGFDSDGVAELDLTVDERDDLRKVIIDASDRILAAGSAGNVNYGHDLAVIRLTSTGAPDTSFAGDGIALAALNGPYESEFSSVVVQSNCKILAGGWTSTENSGSISLVRYNSDGSLDTTFGDAGVVLHEIQMSSSVVHGLALQPDGKILVADAFRTPNDASEAALVRFKVDGSLDSSFGTGGMSLTDINTGGGDVWYDLLVLPDGKILATGVTDQHISKDLVVARFNSDGSIDPAFGVGGIYTTASLSYGRGLALTSDGKYLVAGADNSSDELIGVLRLNDDGSLDTSYGGGDGLASSSVEGSGGTNSNPLTIQSDDKALVAGSAWGGSSDDVAVVRFTAEGLPDNTFDGDGMTIDDFGGYQLGREVRVQDDGKIVVAGFGINTGSGHEEFITVRYNANGSLDAGYGNGGFAGYEYNGDDSRPYGMAFGDGHVYLAGYTNDDYGAILDLVVPDVAVACQADSFQGVVSLGDLNGNGSPEVGVAMPGSTRVHIRDGSTDALITDIDFGADVAFDMAVLPDLDASGDPEIAILLQQASGQVRVQARDTVTGAVTKNLWYGLQYEPVSMDVVADYSGNGLPEVAVLGSEAGTDAVRVQIQDTSTGFLDNVFLGTQSIAADLVSVADTSGNGIPEMGILGVLKANDQVRMQMWDADTAAFQSNVWFAKVYQPQSTITMPDINSNGSDEIVAVGVDPATQNIRVQVRDSDTTATLYNIWLGAVNEAVDIALINDINSDGVADLAVLLKTPDGTGRVRVQSGLNGNFIRNLFYTVVENPVGLAVMPDYSGNGFDELAVLGENAGTQHVQILDTNSGSQVNRIDFP